MSSLHKDLSEQAHLLAKKEPRRPKQASLRRAVSADYYALFHLLTSEASAFLIGTSSDKKQLRAIAQRAFVHSHMKDTAKSFGGGVLPQKVLPAMQGAVLQNELKRVANCFVDLQQARHEADYDTLRSFSKSETLDLIEQTNQAFHDWRIIRNSLQAKVFLASLLVLQSVRN